MPSPNNYNDRESFLKACVPMAVQEGKSQEEAVAMCNSMWDNRMQTPEPKPKKSKFDIISELKKLIDKNDLFLADEILIQLYNKMQNVNAVSEVYREMEKKENVKKIILDLKALGDINLEQVYEIMVFPKKRMYFENYGYIDFSTQLFKEMIDNFNDPKLFKPFGDEQHQLGQKFFNILSLSDKGNGLFAKIKLTPLGYDAIKNEKYSYISPEWGDRVDTDKKKHKNVLMAITLTNIPAMEGEVPTLQEQIKLTKSRRTGGKSMFKLDKTWDITKKLEMTPTLLQAEEGIDPAVVAEIGAMLQEALAKIQELVGQNEEQQEEMGKLETANKEVTKELSDIKAAELDREWKELHSSAVEKGQWPSSEAFEALKKKAFLRNKDEIVEELKYLQSTQNSKETTTGTGTKSLEISAENRKILEDSGYDLNNPEDLKLAKEKVLND